MALLSVRWAHSHHILGGALLGIPAQGSTKGAKDPGPPAIDAGVMVHKSLIP